MYRLTLQEKYYGGTKMYFPTEEEAQKYMEEHIPSEVWEKVKIVKVVRINLK